MQNRKIVVIGAGSAEFGSQSLYGIMNTEGLHGFELHLVDIDPEKLDLISRLADRMNRLRRKPVNPVPGYLPRVSTACAGTFLSQIPPLDYVAPNLIPV
jgi:hypothetical protein